MKSTNLEEILNELKVQTKLLTHIAIQSTIAAQCAYMKLSNKDRLEIAKMIKENIPE